MPTALDIRLRPAATRLIAKYGKSVLLRRMVTPDYDTASGSAEPVPVDYAIKMAVVPPSAQMLRDGLAQSGDRVGLVSAAALSITPLPTDKILMDGKAWQILRAPPTYSGELVALYELHMRA